MLLKSIQKLKFIVNMISKFSMCFMQHIENFGISKQVTNLDAYERVLYNISNVVNIINLQVNMAATKKRMEDIETVIEKCKENEELQIYVKQADCVFGISECYKCNDICQEGNYEMRLSTGGYLNFCNRVNGFGVDTNGLNANNPEETFKRYLKILEKVKDGEYKSFFKDHTLL